MVVELGDRNLASLIDPAVGLLPQYAHYTMGSLSWDSLTRLRESLQVHLPHFNEQWVADIGMEIEAKLTRRSTWS